MVDDTGHVRHILEGMNYYEFIERLMAGLEPRSYFEIGVNNGNSIRRASCATVGVDPKFVFKDFEVQGAKPELHLFQMTSDDFFRHKDLAYYFPQGVDLSFLDGMHLFEFLLRDFINTERYCHAGSVVLMHDCLPINAEMTERRRNGPQRRDQKLAGAWTGDVWKIVPILRAHRPDLDLRIMNCPPTGLVVIRGLDSSSTVLAEAYDAIVAEWTDRQMTDDELVEFREGMRIEDAQAHLGEVTPVATA